MSDVALVLGPAGGDLVLEDGDLRHDEGLASAVMLSLFTDAREEGATALEGADVRGWWAQDDGDPYGSLLWTLAREKTTGEYFARVRQHAAAALGWLVTDGYAERVEIDASLLSPGHVLLSVRLVRGRAKRGAAAWAATGKYLVPFGTGLLDLSTL